MKFTTFVFVALLSLFTASCKDFEEIKVIGVDSFYLNKLNMDGIEAEVKLKIKNPNTVGFSVYPSEFDILFSGIRLGKAKLNKRVHIDSNCERVYSFKLKSGFGDLNILDVTRLLNMDNIGKIEVKGNLKVGKMFVKKKVPVDFSERINLLKL